jgi:predicted nucleic acid-binding protein
MNRIYVDTSVFGGYFESEFELWSKIFFEHIIKGEIKMLFSQMTEFELEKAPQKVKDLILKIPEKNIEFLSINNEAIDLADKYISENVVGKTSRPDCLHIAIATLHNADVLASWNFKHIVNITRIRGYNGVNYMNGYKMLEIRTPREIIEQ